MRSAKSHAAGAAGAELAVLDGHHGRLDRPWCVRQFAAQDGQEMVLHGPAQPQQVRIPFPCVVDAVEAAVVQLVEEVEGELEALPEGVGVPYGGGGVRRWATRPQGPGDALGQCSAPVDEPGPVARSGADSGGGALTRPCRQVGRG